LTRDHPAATTLVVIIVVVVVVIALLVVIVVIVLLLPTVIIFFFPLLISLCAGVKLHRSSSTRADTYVICTSSFSHVLQEKDKISMHANYHSR
jgi:hypothetical protein